MRKPFIENSRPLTTIVSHHDIFMTTRYFVPRTLFWCPLKRWLDDTKECIQSGWSKKCDCCSFAHEFPAADAGRFESCISRKLFQVAISTWIWNGSSIECHEKKHHPFTLSGVRFGSQAIQISGWKSAGRWSGRKWAFHPWLSFISCSKSQRKTHQIAQMRHFELQKFCNEQTV